MASSLTSSSSSGFVLSVVGRRVVYASSLIATKAVVGGRGVASPAPPSQLSRTHARSVALCSSSSATTTTSSSHTSGSSTWKRSAAARPSSAALGIHSSFAAFIGISPMVTSTRRGYVNAFLRTPTRSLIPSQAANGDPIDRDILMMQFNSFVEELTKTALVDTVHLMNEFPSWEAVRAGDTMANYADVMLPMPYKGKEHRLAEVNETLRFVRASGSNAMTQDILQQDDRATAEAGDFLILPNALAVAESARTNAIAIELLSNAHVNQQTDARVFNVHKVVLQPGAPPLADMIGFTADAILVHWNSSEAIKAAGALSSSVKGRNWRTVAIPPQTSFLTFFGGLPRYDVIVEAESDAAIEALISNDLNAVPVEWSEWKKLGITMRSMVLVLRFARGGYGGGGVGTQRNFARSAQRVSSGAPRADPKTKGDKGSPLWAQLRMGEFEVCFQPPPRYNPKMHRPGGLMTRPEDDEQQRQ